MLLDDLQKGYSSFWANNSLINAINYLNQVRSFYNPDPWSGIDSNTLLMPTSLLTDYCLNNSLDLNSILSGSTSLSLQYTDLLLYLRIRTEAIENSLISILNSQSLALMQTAQSNLEVIIAPSLLGALGLGTIIAIGIFFYFVAA
jgi:hypothetical protein